MQRLKEYAGFAVWFLGLSYIVMWPLTTPHFAPESGPLACRDDIAALLPALCALSHPQAMPLPVHMTGLLAAITVVVRLLLIALRTARKPPADPAVGEPRPRLRMRRPPPTVMRVKSRDHFGLRGTPR